VVYPGAASFRAAGYASIKTNNSYVGGVVRQHGNVSFSRVFESGHLTPAYQPETVFRIFQRALAGQDIATGQVQIGANTNYSSAGPASSFSIKNAVPPSPPPVCYLYLIRDTCLPEDVLALQQGTAVVQNFVVTDISRSVSAPANTSSGSPPGSSLPGPTGHSGASRGGMSIPWLSLMAGLAVGAFMVMS
jgi:hypothetical protein